MGGGWWWLGVCPQGAVSGAVVFPAIYIIALGTGGIKPNVGAARPCHR